MTRPQQSGDGFATMAQLIAQAVACRPDAPAVVVPDRVLTHAELGRLLAAACDVLREHGLGRGDRIAIAGPNDLAYVVAYCAAQCLGIATVEAGFRESLETLGDMVARSHPGLVITEREDLRETVGATCPALGFGEFLALCRDRTRSPGDATPLPQQADPTDVSSIVFTSGTTGTPKGVVLSHANFAFVVAAIMSYLELRPDDRYGLVLPLNHTYGKTALLSTLGAGAAVVLLEPFQNLPAFLHMLAERRCTLLSAVPYHAQILLQRADLAALDLSALRAITFSGNKLYPETLDALQAALPRVRVFSMYGLTESTTRSCYVPPEHLAAHKESCGRPLPGVKLRIVDENGHDVPPGAEGEVLIQGPNVMQGYLDDPELTAATLVDGWLHTGDLGHVDEDGFLYLKGRKTEIIKCAGERISPLEIEKVLLAHPDVAEAAVVGRADPLLGEAVHAYVVASGESFDRAAVARFCAQHLSPHKLPRRYVLVDALPKTATGKVKRKLLEASA